MGTIISGKDIWVNGEKLPPAPERKNYTNITTVGNHVYVNGYEYKHGQWKRTLRALWYLLF